MEEKETLNKQIPPPTDSEIKQVEYILKTLPPEKKEEIHKIAIEVCIWRGYSTFSENWLQQLQKTINQVAWLQYLRSVSGLEEIIQILGQDAHTFLVDKAYQIFRSALSVMQNTTDTYTYQILLNKKNEFFNKAREIAQRLLPAERVNERIVERLAKNIAYDVSLKSPYIQSYLRQLS